MSKYINNNLKDLAAYVPGEQPRDMQYVKLNTNESPFPLSSYVVDNMTKDALRKANLYSDPTSKVLKEKIAARYNVLPENVFISNGSDEALNFLFMGFFDKQGVAFPNISYGFYPVFANLYNLNYVEIPLDENFRISVKDYCKDDRNVVIANPNAPTGIALTLDEIEYICKNNKNLVVIDEAYVDFGADSAIKLIRNYPNLVVVQTFSKSRSFAGGRLGFTIASKEIISDLEKIKYSTNPYNINSFTQLAGKLILEDDSYYANNCKTVMGNREYTVKALKELGFVVLPSSANFIFAKTDKISGENLYLTLKKKGVLVRHFTKELIKNYVRITIGSIEQMQILIAKIKEILNETK